VSRSRLVPVANGRSKQVATAAVVRDIVAHMMSDQLTAVVGRAMLGSAFIVFGFEAVKEPGEGRILAAARLGLPNPEALVRANGAAMVVGGLSVALGLYPRVGAAALVGSMIPTTYAGHPYWQHQDEAKRFADRIHFFKNLSLIGALVGLVVARRERC
jgi:putative oxidoreductase